MKLAGDVLFNLLVNAVSSFWLGLAICALLLRIGLRRASGLSLSILLLPFVKVVWDLLHGIPGSSFLWASERGFVQRLGAFRVGFGATATGPVLRAELWAHHRGGISPQSLPDVLARALSHEVWAYAPGALGFALVCVSVWRLGRSAHAFAALHGFVRRVRAECDLIEERQLGFRRVQVLTSRAYEGVPFTSGTLRPFVVLPARLLASLTERERNAVLEHELGHVAHFDFALLVPLQLLREALWYVPGAGWLLGRIRTLLEFRADDAAVAAGVSRRELAGALLTVAGFTLTQPPPQALAMSRGSSLLRTRLERLLSPPSAPRARARVMLVARVLVIAWFMLGALQAVALGNHG
jgi:Zn-dependent protease with chaperone function